MYHLQHHAYCGLAGIPQSFDGRDEARDFAARKLRHYRRMAARIGATVTILERGRKWEVLEPNDCALVPDLCGTITLTRETFDCRECGFAHDTRDEAYACCTNDDYFADPDDYFEDPDDFCDW